MRVIQALIVGAVVASNIQWKWTPNPLAALLVGVGIAFVMTVPPVAAYHKVRIWLAKRRKINVPADLTILPPEEPELERLDDFELRRKPLVSERPGQPRRPQ